MIDLKKTINYTLYARFGLDELELNLKKICNLHAASIWMQTLIFDDLGAVEQFLI